MAKAFKTILYGLLILTFHLNLGSIKIFPAFVGWIFVYRGIVIFEKYSEDKNIFLAKFSAIGLIIISLLSDISLYLFNGLFYSIYTSIAFGVLSTLLEMFVVHILLKATIKNLQDKQANELAESLITKDKLYMFFYGLTLIAYPIQFIFYNFVIGMFLIIFLLFVKISIIVTIYKLQKWYEEISFVG